MNYMNVLSDFEMRLNAMCPVNDHAEEVSRLSAALESKDHLIKELQEMLTKLEKKAVVRKSTTTRTKKTVSATTPAKKAAVATVTRKTVRKGTSAKKVTSRGKAKQE
jgi:alpha-amylase